MLLKIEYLALYVLKLICLSMKPSESAKVFGICIETVCDWLYRFKATGDYSSKQRVGCEPKFRFTDKASILASITRNPDANGLEIRDVVAPLSILTKGEFATICLKLNARGMHFNGGDAPK